MTKALQEPSTGGTNAQLRLDKWLWYARFFKSRSMAARACAGRKVRLNRRVIDKPHHGVRIGDVLTFVQGPRVRVVRVQELGTRRGPAAEAGLLYEDLTQDSGAPRRAPMVASPGIPHRERSYWARRRGI